MIIYYNYIVIDEKHYKQALKLIPEYYGIYVLEKNEINEDKKAILNTNLDAIAQLSLFTKKELQQSFRTSNPNIFIIREHFCRNEINKHFKEMLKNRYQKKWNFLRNNFEHILPIDYQYFFHHNVKPEIIYRY